MTGNGDDPRRRLARATPAGEMPLPTKLLLWVIVVCLAALLVAGTIAAVRALL